MNKTGISCSAIAVLAIAFLVLVPVARAQGNDTSSHQQVRRLSLDDALTSAAAKSPDLAIARAGVTRAEGQRDKARSQFLPQIFGSAGYTRTLKSQFQGLSFGSDSAGPPACSSFLVDPNASVNQRLTLLESALGCGAGSNPFGSIQNLGFGAANQWNLGLSLQQNVFTGGRVTAQYRAANAGRRSATIGLTAAKAQLTLDVTQAYYDAQLADRLVAIAQATLSQADTTLAQTKLGRQVGNAAEFDLLRAQVTRDNQVPVLIQRRSDRDVAYVRLKQLLHLPLTDSLALTTSLDDSSAAQPGSVSTLLAQAPDTAAESRAPVRQAAENVTAQKSAVTVAHAERIPSLSLTSAFGRVAYPSGIFPSWSDFRSNWTVGGSLTLPIFTGGNIHGDEQIATAGLQQARAQLQQTRELAELDALNALNKLKAAQAQMNASRGTAEQAARAYQIATVRYKEGISTQTELNDAQIQLQQAEANRATAARDLQVARMRLALLRDLPLTGSSAQAAQSQTQVTTQAATLAVPLGSQSTSTSTGQTGTAASLPPGVPSQQPGTP
ncbi:MAG TPA: TolC family protein [Gemmatimonadaceae bacterium]